MKSLGVSMNLVPHSTIQFQIATTRQQAFVSDGSRSISWHWLRYCWAVEETEDGWIHRIGISACTPTTSFVLSFTVAGHCCTLKIQPRMHAVDGLIDLSRGPPEGGQPRHMSGARWNRAACRRLLASASMIDIICMINAYI